jgi:hypothetical protein
LACRICFTIPVTRAARATSDLAPKQALSGMGRLEQFTAETIWGVITSALVVSSPDIHFWEHDGQQPVEGT